MSSKKITIEMRLRNMLRRGLDKAGAALQSFGKLAANAGKAMAKGFLVAGAAAVALGVKALQAFSVQESAEKSAEAALRAHGDEIAKNLAHIKKFAAAIQDETGVADENLIARAAKLRMLGVEVDALEAATKATVALKSAGMKETQAIRAVALARQGNYTTLQRYIPALRVASSEAEKAKIVSDFMRRGYEQQAAALDTVAGRWMAFKGRVGDALEEIGRAINKSGAIKGALHRAGEAVKAFGQRIREWVDSKHFEAVQQSIAGIVNALASKEDRGETLKALGGVVVAFFTTGAVMAGEKLMEYAPKIGNAIARGVQDATGYMTQGRYAEKMYELGRPIVGPRRSGSGQTEAVTAEMTRMEKALARLAAITDRHNGSVVDDLADPYPDGPPPMQFEKGAGDDAFAQALADVAAARDMEAQKLDLLAEKEKLLAEERKKNAAAAIEQARAQVAATERLAATSVRSYISEARAKKSAARQWERDQEMAEKLKKRAHLTEGQREFIQAVDAIGAAKAAAPGQQAQLTKAEKELAAMQEQGRTLHQVRDEIIALNQGLQKLLAAG
jgi:hypothetical protein